MIAKGGSFLPLTERQAIKVAPCTATPIGKPETKPRKSRGERHLLFHLRRNSSSCYYSPPICDALGEGKRETVHVGLRFILSSSSSNRGPMASAVAQTFHKVKLKVWEACFGFYQRAITAACEQVDHKFTRGMGRD